MSIDDRPNVSYGDRDVAEDNEIIRTVVGSGVHGLAIEGTDDHDEMGVFIEPPEHALGTRAPFKHYVGRTQPEGVRSGPGDTDLTIYSLRRWMGLAINGNPTVLLPLFAPVDDLIVITDLALISIEVLAPGALFFAISDAVRLHNPKLMLWRELQQRAFKLAGGRIHAMSARQGLRGSDQSRSPRREMPRR